MRQFRRIAATVLAAAAFVAIAGSAEALPQDGDWAGVLEASGQKLRLVLHIKTDGGTSSAVLDSLDQGASVPSTAVKADGGEISILFLAVGGELKGVLSADGKSLVGTWTQGAALPLTLTRQAPPTGH